MSPDALESNSNMTPILEHKIIDPAVVKYLSLRSGCAGEERLLGCNN